MSSEPASRPVVLLGFGIPADLHADRFQQSLKFGMIRQPFGFGITALDSCPHLIQGETFLGLAQAQAAQSADAQTQGPIRRHATGIKFLPRRDGGSLAHRRRQLQEPFVAEGLATGPGGSGG